MSAAPRPEIRERFRLVVARAIERADREQAEHLARLRASGTVRSSRFNPPGRDRGDDECEA